MFEGFDGWLRVDDKPYSVSEFLERTNFTLERELSGVALEGEVSSFKVNQGKWVFFELKDDGGSVNCFLPLHQLAVKLRDGMKIEVLAQPKVTRWGKFSLTIRRIIPRGEGDIKKSLEFLKKKLAREGLFDLARKRELPSEIQTIGVISSTGAAGYIDFLKILDNRWGGMRILTVNTQVQGVGAPAQIVQGLSLLNQCPEVDIIAIVRGGGSADDLAAFNDEELARAIAASRIPVITGIGHEVDESLADLAADIRASTPSNAAERLTRDRRALAQQMATRLYETKRYLITRISEAREMNQAKLQAIHDVVMREVSQVAKRVAESRKLLDTLNPERVLERGYAIVRGDAGNIVAGQELELTTRDYLVVTRVKNVRERIRPSSSKLAVTRVKGANENIPKKETASKKGTIPKKEDYA